VKTSDAELLAALGASLGILGRRDEAIAALSRAIAIDPKHFDAHNNLGNVYRDDGKLDLAIASFDQALALNPQFFEAKLNRGQVLHRLGRPAHGVGDLREAVRLRPDRVDAQRTLSDALLASGQRAECIAILDRIIASGAGLAVGSLQPRGSR
jgi:tetratricopeptide (TPR) repeat protein